MSNGLSERRIRLEVAYRGTHYHGWQHHDGVPTVQGQLEAELERVVGIHTPVVGSSRTDAGVHALAQTAAFTTTSVIPATSFVNALNAGLPHDIRVQTAVEAPLAFHPIDDCVRKKYRYLIDDRAVASPFLAEYVWSYRSGTLDVEKMHAAAQFLAGEHDFASFQSQGAPRLSTVRTIFDVSVQRGICCEPPGIFPIPLIILEITGSGFLYKMVRAIAGTLVQVGSGRRSVGSMTETLAACDRSKAGQTAPASGLFLTQISFRGE
ncbi:MAG: tRNA pseudouridine(38-40) synthase TruA [Planctomycetaceae bacterium]|nr:tRNA pseudouridine(38-40) synthase TruA [Planctomycetaceae bacterium]